MAAAAAAVEGATAEDDRRYLAVKTVYFQPTPLMPTYVFGFWVADFRCLTTRALATGADHAAGPLLCCESLIPALPPLQTAPTVPPPPPQLQEETGKVVHPGAETVEVNVHVLGSVGLNGAEFALDLARRAFELFSRLFSVRFPLAKLDLLGLPRMPGLGMENFGAITLLQVCRGGWGGVSVGVSARVWLGAGGGV